MKFVNVSHIKKHADDYLAVRLTNILRVKIDLVLRYGYSKIERSSGTYYTKTQTGFFDIRVAIAAMKKASDNRYCRQKEFDYQKYIDVLELVLADRVKFGGKIPDTTDTWGEFYFPSGIVRSPRKNKEKLVADKKAKKKKFSERFSEAEIVWS